MYNPKTSRSGFTLIEMLVSLAVFSIVVTMSVGTLLVLIASNQQLQDQQSTMSNLAFALDGMTRDIRTGTYFYCDSGDFANQDNNISVTDEQECHNGDDGLSFVEAGDSITSKVAGAERIAFYFENNTLYRRIGNADPERLLSSNIYVHDGAFVVTGTERMGPDGPGPEDTEQPSVTIYVEASEPDIATCGNPDPRCVRIQTTVTQRQLDL